MQGEVPEEVVKKLEPFQLVLNAIAVTLVFFSLLYAAMSSSFPDRDRDRFMRSCLGSADQISCLYRWEHRDGK